MTCVAFQAIREYIVGKTAPVPVKIYDYYEPGMPLKKIFLVHFCQVLKTKGSKFFPVLTKVSSLPSF